MNDNAVAETPANSSGFMSGLMRNGQGNAPKIPQDTLPRYGMSFLLPIALHNQRADNFFGDFNPKIDPDDHSKGNLVNINYFPAFETIAFYGATMDVPFERNPGFTNEIVKDEPFDFGGFQTNVQAGWSTLTRTAKECANLALMQHKELGLTVFESLTGFHYADEDLGLSACEMLIGLILPLRNSDIFPQGDAFVRIKNGVRFDAPFLDQIDEFVRTESLQRIIAKNLKPETRVIAEKLRDEIRAGISSALKIANTILNESETEIKDEKGTKKGYDEPDLLTDDAPIPTDLYCLAHTNRTEIEQKNLKQSENIGSAIGSSITEAFGGLKDALLQNQQSETIGKSMSPDEVQKLLAKQREDLQKGFDKKIADQNKQFQQMIDNALKNQPKPKDTPTT